MRVKHISGYTIYKNMWTPINQQLYLIKLDHGLTSFTENSYDKNQPWFVLKTKRVSVSCKSYDGT